MAKENAMITIREFALIAFVLLAVLFGMMIMNFIFGVLGNSNINILTDDTVTKENVHGGYVNITFYTIPEASDRNFNGGFAVSSAINGSSGTVIVAANYTVNAGAGTLINATALLFNNVTLNYTYSIKTSAKLASEDAQNNSLQAIITYTEGADTQMSTVSIAIILALLIVVFLLFWRVFVTSQAGKGSGGPAGSFG